MSNPPPPSWPTPPGGQEPTPPTAAPGWVPPPPPPGYGDSPDYYGLREEERGSSDLAAWALGLAIVPCFFPLSTIGAVVLAIISLSGRRRGTRRAIAALVVATAWVTLVIVLAANGTLERWFADDDASSGSSTSSGPSGLVTSADVQVGDCLIDPALLELEDGETTAAFGMTIVDCEEPHAQEAYAGTTIHAAEFPGDHAVQQRAERFCLGRFHSFVGVAPARSTLDVYYYLPTPISWAAGQHRITCLVSEGVDTTVGSLRHSRR